MDNYKNVDVDKLANIYFEGKVISRNIFLKDGLTNNFTFKKDVC